MGGENTAKKKWPRGYNSKKGKTVHVHANKARSVRADSDKDDRGQDLSHERHAWAVRMRQSNEGHRKRTARTCGRQKLWTDRTALPTFDGSQESWWEFGRLFKEML